MLRTLMAIALFSVLTGVALAQDVAPGRVTLRAEEVDRAASRKLGAVKRCYKAALDRAPRSYGTIGIGFRIAPDGVVTERFVALSTLADPVLEKCVVDAFDGVKFPAPGAFGAVARFGVLLKTDESPEAALKTQEDAYRRAIRDLPTVLPDATPASKLPPGFEGLDSEREGFGPLSTPTPQPK